MTARRIATASKLNMGHRTIQEAQPRAEEVEIGKNYRTGAEFRGVQDICEQFTLFTASKAFRGQKMTMEELTAKLNILLQANNYPMLYRYEKAQRQQAGTFAWQELDHYRARISPAKQPKKITGAESDKPHK